MDYDDLLDNIENLKINAKLIRKTRTESGLTQLQAAKLIHAGHRSWQYWESGNRKMSTALFELFVLKLKLKQE